MVDIKLIAVVMVVAIIIIAIVIYKSISGGSKSKTAVKDERPSGTISMPGSSGSETGRKIIMTGGGTSGGMSGGSMPGGGVVMPADSHRVDKIYSCIFPTNIWVCAECECENDFGRADCCVCKSRRS